MKDKAFVSLSGGIDSTTALMIAIGNHGHENVHAVSFDYGQRHSKELDCAVEIAASLGIKHSIVKLPNIPKNVLTDPTAHIPGVSYAEIKGVSFSYVPFRNGLMLATLAAMASPLPNSQNEAHIYAGMHAEDAANDAYPDCRLDFIGTMGAAIYIGSYHRVRLHAPLIEMTKADVVAKGLDLGAPFELTWSCYKGEELHCGACPTCRARKDAFAISGVDDPTMYAV